MRLIALDLDRVADRVRFRAGLDDDRDELRYSLRLVADRPRDLLLRLRLLVGMEAGKRFRPWKKNFQEAANSNTLQLPRSDSGNILTRTIRVRRFLFAIYKPKEQRWRHSITSTSVPVPQSKFLPPEPLAIATMSSPCSQRRQRKLSSRLPFLTSPVTRMRPLSPISMSEPVVTTFKATSSSPAHAPSHQCSSGSPWLTLNHVAALERRLSRKCHAWSTCRQRLLLSQTV